MAATKKISKDSLIKMYMSYVMEHQSNPGSVYNFATKNGFKESEFYQHFASFESLEREIFKGFLEHAIETLHKSAEYETFDNRNKLLSLYFTLFEIFTANRSYVLQMLKPNLRNLKSLKMLLEFKKVFLDYIDELNFPLTPLHQKQFEDIRQKALKESAWMQFLFILDFWMKDSSKGFEKTDILIEKSIHTGMDFIDAEQFRSIIDLGKFLYQERSSLFS